MTDAQWLFEYEALRRKDEEDMKHQHETMMTVKKVLIGLLGLDLNMLRPDVPPDADPNIVPLSLLCEIF